MTTIGNKFAQLGTSIINLVGTRASKNMDNLTSTGEANIVEIVENAGISGKGSGHSIGEIVYSAIPISGAGFHLLDGGLIYGDGIYNDFVTYMSTLYAADPTANYWTTETDWQSSVSTYGVCGKFVYDSTNNTVRLPKVTGIIEGTTDVTALGDLVEAGLPNITGTVGYFLIGNQGNKGYQSGAFADSTSSAHSGAHSYSDNRYSKDVVFDASHSSSIYGNSSTVQPQTIKTLVYIVIATDAKTDIQVDIDEIATELNGKADVDFTNCTFTPMNNNVIHIIDTYINGNSGYRIWSDGYCEQWGYSNVSQDRSTNISLMKTMLNGNYNALLVSARGTDNEFNNGKSITALGTTYFTVYDQDYGGYVRWRVFGYLANGQY